MMILLLLFVFFYHLKVGRSNHMSLGWFYMEIMYASKYDQTQVDCKQSSPVQAEILQLCSLIATKSPLTHKHGCIIMKNKLIISQAFNDKSKNNHEESVHAEVAAIRKVKRQLDETCTLFVVRIGTASHYKYKYSKPCEVCASMIRKNRIGKVYYTVNVKV
jgi:deoxycytidylate deaminase